METQTYFLIKIISKTVKMNDFEIIALSDETSSRTFRWEKFENQCGRSERNSASSTLGKWRSNGPSIPIKSKVVQAIATRACEWYH